jgi:CBS domain containing-hemolysin-like protein
MARLGRLPVAGDSVDITERGSTVRLTVVQMTVRRAEQIRVQVIA